MASAETGSESPQMRLGALFAVSPPGPFVCYRFRLLPGMLASFDLHQFSRASARALMVRVAVCLPLAWSAWCVYSIQPRIAG